MARSMRRMAVGASTTECRPGRFEEYHSLDVGTAFVLYSIKKPKVLNG